MNRLQQNSGFSLIEVIIALAIFSIGIVGLYAVQTQTISQNTTSSRITTAVTWASDKAEDLLGHNYKDLTDVHPLSDPGHGVAGLSATNPNCAPGNNAVDGCEVSPDGIYTLQWNVAENRPIYRSKIIRVIVTSQRAGTGRLVDMEYVKHEGI